MKSIYLIRDFNPLVKYFLDIITDGSANHDIIQFQLQKLDKCIFSLIEKSNDESYFGWFALQI